MKQKLNRVDLEPDVRKSVIQRLNEHGTAYRSLNDLPLTLTVEELRSVLNVGRNTAYSLVRSGQIRSVRVGKQLRISRDALVEFLAENSH